MNTFDIIMSVILGFSLVYGLFKGLISFLSGWLTLALGVYAAIRFSSCAESLIGDRCDPRFAGIAAFVLTLVAVIVAVHYLSKLVDRLVEMTALSPVNRIAGGLLATLCAATIVSLLMHFAGPFCADGIFPDSQTRHESLVYPYVGPIADLIIPAVGEMAQNLNTY